MEYRLTSIHDHPRGKVYEVEVNGKFVSVLLTYHVLKDSNSGVLPTISSYGRCSSPKRCSSVIMAGILPISAEVTIWFG